MDDEDLKNRLKIWQIEPPNASLANRIVERAVRHEQITPPGLRLSRILDCAFSDWRYGLTYKAASIVLIAGIGLMLGIASPYPTSSETIDIVDLALGGGLGET